MTIPPEYPQDEPPEEPRFGAAGEVPSPAGQTNVEIPSPADDTQAKTERAFEDLTLAELVGQFIRRPRETWSALVDVATTPPNLSDFLPPVMPVTAAPALPIHREPVRQRIAVIRVDTPETRRAAAQLGFYITAFILAWVGTGTLINAPFRVESQALDSGAPFLLMGFIAWLIAEVVGHWPGVVNWWQRVSKRKLTETAVQSESPSDDTVSSPDVVTAPVGGVIHPVRAFLALGGLFFSFGAWQGNANNRFSTIGALSWFASIVLWTMAFAPASWSPTVWFMPAVGRLRAVRIRGNWTLGALLLIIVLGAVFRLTDLEGVPPEMTSDHVEKLLDAQRIWDGNPQVFFPNNGGREPFQMYAMALFSRLPGLGMNFTTLKLLAVLEALITLPVLWWMGREVIGEQDRRLGNIVGLLLAALVAASYWHTAITRLALRIVLTPLVTALLLIFLSRALRYNRRGDFILTGLVLGWGLYTYQAVRMLPLVVLAGVGLAVVFKARSLRERGLYLYHLAVLVLISFVIFVPLFGFSIDASIGGPDHFWRRTFGRLLGDDIIQTTDASGNIITRNATLQERLEAFNKNLPVLMDNIRNALLMYNWKGDVAWINGLPNYPAMDALTGALLIVGLAAWGARMVRRRDIVDWLIPAAMIIMIFPSALSIAYPIENPSATRMTGTLPEAYLFAALPLGLVVVSLRKTMGERAGMYSAALVCALIVLGAYVMNSNVYFGWGSDDPQKSYRASYINSSLPYSEAGRILRGFAESDGSYGNAFMIAYPYWWDHRAVGIAAGLIDWPNGIITLNDVPFFLYDASLRTGRYRFDPNRDILFFYSLEDTQTDAQLKTWFPNGRDTVFRSYQPGSDFKLYRVPWLGQDGFRRFLADTDILPSSSASE